MRKLIFTLLSVILLFGCGNNKNDNSTTDTSSSNISEPKEVKKSNDLIIGQTLSDEYFDITIRDIALGNRVNTGNMFTNIKPEKDNMFMVFFIKFKNTHNESHYVNEGSILIDDNGTKYTFDKTENIMLEGWGVLLDELNPLTTLDTKIVYKLPKEIKGKVYWVSEDGGKIYLGDISDQKMRLSNEKPKQKIEEKAVAKSDIEPESKLKPKNEESDIIPTDEDFEDVKKEQVEEITYYKISDPDKYSNLRDAPKGKIVRRVLESEKFEVIGNENGYKKVKLYDGTIGYIHQSRVVKHK